MAEVSAAPSLAISTVLVTGGSGLVGSAIQWAVSRHDPLFGRREGEHWVFLSSCDGDLRDYVQAKAIFQKHRPKQVIHLAARVGGVFENSTRQLDFLRDNLAIDQNVLRLCHEFQVQNMVSCLSTCIFPDKTSYPISESMLHDGPPHASNFGYAYAKRLLDISNRAYAAQHECNFTAVIPTNVYGPDDNFGEGCHFIPAIIHSVAQAKENQLQKIQVPGSGIALRQFLYSRDLAKIMIWTLRMYNSSEPLIVSVDQVQETSIKAVVEMVCELSGFVGSVEWDTSKTDGQLRKTADNTRLKNQIGNFEFTRLQQGLKETLVWYHAKQGRVRGHHRVDGSKTADYGTTGSFGKAHL